MWHVFLHLNIYIKDLYIVFIKSPIFESYDLETCFRCRIYEQKVYVKNIFRTVPRLYTLESYEQPNVIVLFGIVPYFVRYQKHGLKL